MDLDALRHHDCIQFILPSTGRPLPWLFRQRGEDVGAVARGELVEVLAPWAGRSRPFTVLYPQNRHLAARVRAFVDFIADTVTSGSAAISFAA